MTTTLVVDAAAVVWMSGEDRLGFLERLSTARLTDLSPGNGRATAVLTDIGRVVDFVGCYAAAKGIILVTSAPGVAPALAGHLRRYVLFNDRVRITDASEQVTVLRLIGLGAAGMAGMVTGIDVAALPPSEWAERGEGEEAIWILPHVPPDRSMGVDIVIPHGARADVVRARMIEAGAALASADSDALALARIEARRPAWGAEIDGTTNPLELDLRDVVDFDKGCYIGQEVVARLDTYAKVQRRMVRLRSAAPLNAGDRVIASGGTGDTSAGSETQRTSSSFNTSARSETRRSSGVVTTAARSGVEWRALALVPSALIAASPATLEISDHGRSTEVSVEY